MPQNSVTLNIDNLLENELSHTYQRMSASFTFLFPNKFRYRETTLQNIKEILRNENEKKLLKILHCMNRGYQGK